MIRVLYNNVHAWDSLLCLKIFGLNGRKTLDLIMYGLSRLGDGYFYAVVGIVLFIVDYKIALKTVPAGLIAFALEITAFKLVKIKTKRDRPFRAVPEINPLMPPPPDKFSFPSGHTAAAFVMATLFGTVFPGLFLPLVVVAALVGFSRIYNGMHFPSDVLAGMVLGFLCAKLGLVIAA